MTTYTSTIHVDVPPDIALPTVIEWLMTPSGRMRYTVLDAPADVVGTRFRYEHPLLGLLGIGGICTLTEYVPSEKVTVQWHGPERIAVGDLRGLWTFTPEDGGTTITVRSVFRPRIPVLHPWAARAMIRRFREVEVPIMKAQMEARAEEART